MEGLWKPQRDSEQHGGRAQLLLKTAEILDFLPFLFLLILELGCLQREFSVLLTQPKVGEGPGTTSAISEENLRACRDHA